MAAGDLDGIQRLVSMQNQVLAYLDQLAATDLSMMVCILSGRHPLTDALDLADQFCICHLTQGISEYSACLWGQELTAELSKIDTVTNIAIDGREKAARLAIAAELRHGIEGLWNDRAHGDVFGGG